MKCEGDELLTIARDAHAIIAEHNSQASPFLREVVPLLIRHLETGEAAPLRELRQKYGHGGEG